MAIRFNAAGENDMPALVPANGAMGGLLHSDGNVCVMTTGDVETKDVSSTGPGTDYELSRVAGTRGRSAQWVWTIKAPDLESILEVKRIVLDYRGDGLPYTLENEWEEFSDFARLVGWREIVPMRVVPGGRFWARWQLDFRILRSLAGTEGLL